MNSKSTPENTLLSELSYLANQVASLPDSLPKSKWKATRKKLEDIAKKLDRVSSELDPVQEPSHVFDPSNPQLVGMFIGLAMVAQERLPLSEVRRFYGSGVYALYYEGPFRLYTYLRGTENPIYVGKAEPAISNAKTPREQDQRLWGRIGDHARSIRKAANAPQITISLDDFYYRYLVVQSGYEVAAEKYLIQLFKPIWNEEIKVCYGLGKHGDNPNTRANKRSPWDTIHPGREWAHRDPTIPDAKSPAQIESEIEDHFKIHRPYQSVDDVLKIFFDELKQKLDLI